MKRAACANATAGHQDGARRSPPVSIGHLEPNSLISRHAKDFPRIPLYVWPERCTRISVHMLSSMRVNFWTQRVLSYWDSGGVGASQRFPIVSAGLARYNPAIGTENFQAVRD